MKVGGDFRNGAGCGKGVVCYAACRQGICVMIETECEKRVVNGAQYGMILWRER